MAGDETSDALPWPPAALLGVLPDAIVVVEDGTIRYATSRIEELSGWSPADLRGEPVEVLIPDELRSSHERRREEFAADPAVRRMGAGLETSLKTREGATLPVEISLAPIHHEDRRFTVAVIRDATEHRAIDLALKRRLAARRAESEQLREADEDKTTFLRAVAHDLRAPFAVISGIAQTVASHGEELSAERTADLLGRLDAQAQRGMWLVNQLLDVDRLTSRHDRLVREQVALRSVVPDAVDRATGRDVELDLDDVVAEVDATLIDRIVHNLVRNADEHTPSDAPIRVGLHEEDGEALLVVEDRGRGVPDEHKQVIFEPFRTTEGRGGVGLSLVARFAEMHGGRAWVEDRPGGGASFRVALPLGEDPPSEAAPS